MDWKLAVVRFFQRRLWLTLPTLAIAAYLGVRYVERDEVKRDDLLGLERLVREQSEKIQKQGEAIAGLNGALSVLLQTRIGGGGLNLGTTLSQLNPAAASAVANAIRLTENIGPEIKVDVLEEFPVGRPHKDGYPTAAPPDRGP